MLLSAAIKSTEVAPQVAPAVVVLFLMFSGYFLNEASIPVWLTWLSNISFIGWTFQALCINEFQGRAFDCDDGPAPGFCFDGDTWLANLNFDEGTLGEEPDVGPDIVQGVTENIDSLNIEDEERPWHLVVAGVTGDGKSSTCNTLAGQDAFVVSGGFASETSECAHADYLLMNQDGVRECRVVDTIGLQDTSLPAEAVMERFSKFSDLVPQGIDVFLFIIRFGRFKPEHEAALDAFVANVGEHALKNTLLVFTGCGLSAAQLEKQLESAPPSLRSILPKLAVPPVGIDNVADRSAARAVLHAPVGACIRANKGRSYSNAALADARARHDVRREEERAAFAAAVADWRKGEGPVVVVRE